MNHIFKLPKKASFKKVGIKGTNFETKKLFDKAKFAVIESKIGHKTVIRENVCTFVYYILEGRGFFRIANEIEKCKKGDLVVIPKGYKFNYEGKMKLFLTTMPWWHPEQEETLE